jgi:aryl-alcohol dehydrogenase-like predicted oxidoreductase
MHTVSFGSTGESVSRVGLGGEGVLLVRCALSCDITLPIVGCSSPDEVRTLVSAAEKYSPLSHEEKEAVHTVFRPYASRMAFYRDYK